MDVLSTQHPSSLACTHLYVAMTTSSSSRQQQQQPVRLPPARACIS